MFRGGGRCCLDPGSCRDPPSAPAAPVPAAPSHLVGARARHNPPGSARVLLAEVHKKAQEGKLHGSIPNLLVHHSSSLSPQVRGSQVAAGLE